MRSAAGYMVLHVDLFVRSMSRALKFYCEGMGFAVADETLLRGPIVHNMSSGAYDEMRLVFVRASPLGAMIELMEYQTGSARDGHDPDSALPKGAVSILVPDLDAHISRAASNGWHPVSDVFTVDLPRRGRSRIVFYEDPDSNRLEFVQAGQNNGSAK